MELTFPRKFGSDLPRGRPLKYQFIGFTVINHDQFCQKLVLNSLNLTILTLGVNINCVFEFWIERAVGKCAIFLLIWFARIFFSETPCS